MKQFTKVFSPTDGKGQLVLDSEINEFMEKYWKTWATRLRVVGFYHFQRCPLDGKIEPYVLVVFDEEEQGGEKEAR